jgi:hypothetical protein
LATTRGRQHHGDEGRHRAHPGAAGGIGAVATVVAMREGQVPPTLNLVAPDEAVGELDCTPLVARERSSAWRSSTPSASVARTPRSCSGAGRAEARGRGPIVLPGRRPRGSSAGRGGPRRPAPSPDPMLLPPAPRPTGGRV